MTALDVESMNETSKLLSDASPDKDKDEYEKVNLEMVKSETKQVMKLVCPIMLSGLMVFSILTESVIMCGRIGTIEMASVGMANSLANIFGFCIATGFCTACDTFFSQIYGSCHRKFLGVMLQRSILCCLTLPLILIALNLNWEPILLLMGQDAEVARLSTKFLTYFSPGFIFIFQLQVLTKYLQNQYIVWIPMIISGIGNIFNIVSQYVLIFHFGYGIEASAVCQAATYFLLCVLLASYIWFSEIYKPHWTGWSAKCLLDWKPFFQLGFSGMGSVFFDCSTWEIVTLACGLLGTIQLATQSILLNYYSFLYHTGFAMGVAMNIRIGEALGAMKYKRALLSLKIGLIGICLPTIFMNVVLISLRQYAGRIFTNDEKVVELTTELLPYMLALLTADNFGTVISGALRGCGLQRVSLLLTLLGYYVIGLPTAFSLAFATTLRLKGFWIGLLFSLLLAHGGAFVMVFFRIDWKRQAEMAEDRVKSNMNQERKDNLKHSMTIADESLTKKHTRNFSTSFVKQEDGTLRPRQVLISNRHYRQAYKRTALLFGFSISALVIGIITRVTVKLPNSGAANVTIVVL